jgi:large subunit ribosomal protein L6
MSRIGKNPISVPAGVQIALNGATLSVEGPKGKVEMTVHPLIAVTLGEGSVTVGPKEFEGRDPKKLRLQGAMWGTTHRLISNMITGVTEGYSKAVQVAGVGYGASLSGDQLVIRCGYANEVSIRIPEDITVDPPQNDSVSVTGSGVLPCATVTIRGIDKQRVGQFAAAVRDIRPPEPYKGKGIRYLGEEVKHKAGKALAAGSS